MDLSWIGYFHIVPKILYKVLLIIIYFRKVNWTRQGKKRNIHRKRNLKICMQKLTIETFTTRDTFSGNIFCYSAIRIDIFNDVSYVYNSHTIWTGLWLFSQMDNNKKGNRLANITIRLLVIQNEVISISISISIEPKLYIPIPSTPFTYLNTMILPLEF